MHTSFNKDWWMQWRLFLLPSVIKIQYWIEGPEIDEQRCYLRSSNKGTLSRLGGEQVPLSCYLFTGPKWQFNLLFFFFTIDLTLWHNILCTALYILFLLLIYCCTGKRGWEHPLLHGSSMERNHRQENKFQPDSWICQGNKVFIGIF